MTAPVTASERDLRALAAIVSEDRPDLPDGEGLPPSLLADLMGQISCDGVAFLGFDGGRQADWFAQNFLPADTYDWEDLDRAYWHHYPASQFCSYPGRTGDLRSVIKNSDFYSARQWHSTGMYTDYCRLIGVEHTLMLCLPEPAPRTTGPERTCGCTLPAGLALTSPSAIAHCSRCCAPTCTGHTSTPNAAATPAPSSPAGSGTCCAWSPPGTPIPRSPADSACPRELCALTWQTSTVGCRSPAAPPPSPAPSRTEPGPGHSRNP